MFSAKKCEAARNDFIIRQISEQVADYLNSILNISRIRKKAELMDIGNTFFSLDLKRFKIFKYASYLALPESFRKF